MSVQTEFVFGPARCPGCGSNLHHGCGYDPETVRPAMSIAEAMSETIRHAVDEHGSAGAADRIPGLMWWCDDRMRDWVAEQTEAVRSG